MSRELAQREATFAAGGRAGGAGPPKPPGAQMIPQECQMAGWCRTLLAVLHFASVLGRFFFLAVALLPLEWES